MFKIVDSNKKEIVNEAQLLINETGNLELKMNGTAILRICKKK